MTPSIIIGFAILYILLGTLVITGISGIHSLFVEKWINKKYPHLIDSITDYNNLWIDECELSFGNATKEYLETKDKRQKLGTKILTQVEKIKEQKVIKYLGKNTSLLEIKENFEKRG